ncbi:4a-hydroxytetrahydrobiopterin dehydratase [Maribacter polysiphoniae]|uniref:Putative pterin-4-alpha-carbinolamine dehydratase n=1 Tax=Maribacter polysiphoniae TaxID=429344 RepID=A0A316E0T6_9FLAO|nr:4a-hydroxytetrahydrobiopterin dehydratase [Maribacter polysiphoniae]MBD1260624.1 4a-hydroxytetrahydrobiopterin dehydratase [Maribacter polysiphoniae]PWK24247.1 4a-hydroxytetrahydrobiopterin dehydratase [Maribacter polysiphoniae]
MIKLSETEIQQKLQELKGWEYIDGAIETTFEFKNFKETFSIMTRIAFECEAQNHHPDWSNVYNTLNIRLNTHDANGVTQKDFQLAQSIEGIIDSE